VLIATPNLCLDRTVSLAEVVPGSVLRARSVEVTAGGKGVNVARVLRAFGQHPPIVGLVAAQDGAHLTQLLTDEGATLVPVPAPGSVRQATIMIERNVDRITVLNEPGTELPPETWAAYRETVRERLSDARLLVCSGSLPPGAPLDGYGQLAGLARDAGVLSIVDTAPPPLAASLAHRPDLVTPNLEEAEAALSGEFGDVLVGNDEDVIERASRAALALCERGARRAAVTAGADGVAFAEHGTVHWLPAAEVNLVSAVGAGDSFVAGLAIELLGLPSLPPSVQGWLAALRRGIATAGSSCEQVRAGGVDPARVAELLDSLAEKAS
jgi:1-phosphofructokinase family hexose kinase